MNQYDVIIIGSDINGLVTSAMIAKSGKKVLVIDEREQIGGLTAMQKFSSGSMINPVYDAIPWIDPRVIKDLELNNYDLEIDNPKTLRIALDKHGKHIKFYSDNELTSNSISNYSLEDAKKWLINLKGVGPKTAAIILCFSFGMPAMPVDTHIYRVSQRLALIGKKISAEQAHDLLESIVEPEEIFQFHMYLIKHGRDTCKAQRPRCTDCTLTDLCPAYKEYR